jgi:hypothetical protein
MIIIPLAIFLSPVILWGLAHLLNVLGCLLVSE